MQVILLSDIDKTGLKGEVVEVSRGFARNFLLPRRLAEVATPGAIAAVKRREAQRAQFEARTVEQATDAASVLGRTVLRFEVTEDPSPGVDGIRFCHTPPLGLWNGAMSANGDIMVGEMRLRTLMSEGADTLAAELDTVLGTAWDEALEPYRDGGDAGEVSWLSRGVG